jgi:hypothetical protein
MVSDDLRSAGAGSDAGAAAFAAWLPALQPRRIGARGADPAGTARAHTFTLVRLLPGAVVTRLAAPFAGGNLSLENGVPCPGRDACGFREDDVVMVFDVEGRHDFVRVDSVSPGSVMVTPRQNALSHLFPVGAFAAVVETRTYYFDAGARQLRVYDGDASDVPIADDVVGMAIEYWGDAGAPRDARPAVGVGTCWLAGDGTFRFGVPAVPGAPLVQLDLEAFRDGPWCGAGENAFDADLLRIRSIRLRLRVAAASDLARGTGAAFLRPGAALNSRRLVPDVELAVDVAPRNLNLGR